MIMCGYIHIYMLVYVHTYTYMLVYVHTYKYMHPRHIYMFISVEEETYTITAINLVAVTTVRFVAGKVCIIHVRVPANHQCLGKRLHQCLLWH